MDQGTLLIRADATLAIGTGHVMRCLALAQAWQERGGVASLATAELPRALVSRLTAEKLLIQRIVAAPGGPEDAQETITHAQKIGAAWIVVDGDHFGSGFLERICGSSFRVLVMDDFAGRDSYPVDLVVNPNLDEDEECYRRRGTNAKICMGPSYILLRREFRLMSAERELPPVAHRVLVTMGGSDPDHLTNRIVAAIAESPDMEVTAVAGAAFDQLAELEALRGNRVRVVANADDMSALMQQSDLAIIAAGGTLWELLSAGCAVLSYSRNLVQTCVIETLSKRGIAVNLGETGAFDAAQLVSRVHTLAASREARERMATLGKRLVDGLGAPRVVEAMLQLGGDAR